LSVISDHLKQLVDECPRGGRMADEGSSLQINVSAWESEAQKSKKNRAVYRAACTRPASGTALGDASELYELLVMVCSLSGSKLLYPAVQVDLRDRATALLARMLDQVLPERRRNSFLPNGREMDSLCREAKLALSPMSTVLLTSKGIRSERSREAQDRLLELWVERNMPLNATERDIRMATERCFEIAKTARERTTRRRDASVALAVVAALLDSTPEVVKKVRAERLNEARPSMSQRGGGRARRRSAGKATRTNIRPQE
jgi:hypothetical protein